MSIDNYKIYVIYANMFPIIFGDLVQQNGTVMITSEVFKNLKPSAYTTGQNVRGAKKFRQIYRNNLKPSWDSDFPSPSAGNQLHLY